MERHQSADSEPDPELRSKMQSWLISILNRHFKEKTFCEHQFSTYNDFLENRLPEIIAENSVINIGNKTRSRQIRIRDVVVSKPTIREGDGLIHNVLPSECRARSLSYMCLVFVTMDDVVLDENGVVLQRQTFYEQLISKIPCMVRSRFCHLSDVHENNKECKADAGGYFIINGNERVLVAQMKVRSNKPFIRVMPSGSKYSHCCEIRSWAGKMRSTSTINIYITELKRGVHPEVVIDLPFIDFSVPMPALFVLLGVTDPKDMSLLVLTDKSIASDPAFCQRVMQMLDKDVAYMSYDDIVRWIGRVGTKEPTQERRERCLRHILQHEVLPHMGTDDSADARRKKAIYLGMCIRKLLLVQAGLALPNNRDTLCDKRIDSAGVLMALLFRQLHRKFIRDFTRTLQKALESGREVNCVDYMTSERSTSSFKYAISTGNWGVQKGGSALNGVSQILQRANLLATIAHTRRITHALNRDGKMIKPRQLDASHWDLICPTETPEGGPCGLVLNLALLAHIRVGYDPTFIFDIIIGLGVKPLLECSYDDLTECVVAYVNGHMVGVHHDPVQLTSVLREMRRNLDIPFDVTIAYLDTLREVQIHTEHGCVLRPLLIVNQLHRLPEVYSQVLVNPSNVLLQLTMAGIIEFIDKDEEQQIHCAVSIEDIDFSTHTHCEIVPWQFMGVCANSIPFPDHNQAPRNVYGAGMIKQASGRYSSVSSDMMQTVSMELDYVQKPLVATTVDTFAGLEEFSSGFNAVVAIMSYTGFNQEDSIITAKSSIEFGMGNTTVRRTVADREKGVGSDRQTFGPLDGDCTGKRNALYDKVDEDGAVAVGEHVSVNTALISKQMQTTHTSEDGKKYVSKIDHSTIIRSRSEGTNVDCVQISDSKDGTRQIKVRTRDSRNLKIGDKMSSRHGQKGVIGMALSREDLPFTASGMTPDIIINPHAIPSRMTIGHLIEMLAGKVAALRGIRICGDAFNRNVTPENLADELEKYGFEKWGNEVMYNGMTGERMVEPAFLGVIFYERLKHFAIDKVHARSRGPTQFLTRQPVEGRSRDGGQRFGEMERDALSAHGCAFSLKDRLAEQSDATEVVVCNKCGMVAQNARLQGSGMRVLAAKDYCKGCASSDHVKKIRTPFALKLLHQELAAMNIAMRMEVADPQPAD